MRVEITEIGSCKKKMEVEVSYSEVKPYIEKKIADYRSRIAIDGFRKGKAPLSIIKKRFGDAINAEVVDELIQIYYQKAVREKKIAVVAPGTIQEVSFEEGKPLKFTAEVDVEPEIEVKDYKGLSFSKEIVRVTDEDVEKSIEILREKKAEIKPVKRGAKRGDIIEGDIQALDGSGVPIIGHKWEDRSFELGKPPLGDIIEDQLLGVVSGEQRRFTIRSKDVDEKGRKIDRDDHYSIRVENVKERILPEAGDKFAKDIGNFESIQELREDIRRNIIRHRQEEAERALRERIADEIIKRNDFELSDSMIENTLNSLVEDYKKYGEEDFDENKFKEKNRAAVIWNLKWNIIWPRIAENEGISVKEDDIEKEIKKIAESSSQNEKKIRAVLKKPEEMRRLKNRILEDKVFDFIKKNSKIKEIEVDPKKKRVDVVS